jgi:hypothetical protein
MVLSKNSGNLNSTPEPVVTCPSAAVTGTVYLDMLERFLEPQLLTGGILDTVVFQQDGAPCHYAIIVCDYLGRRFPGRWIGRGGTQPWAACSPDLTPLNFLPGVSLSLSRTLVEELVT